MANAGNPQASVAPQTQQPQILQSPQGQGIGATVSEMYAHDGFMTEAPEMRGFDYSKGVYKDGYGPIQAFVETQQPQILQSPQGIGNMMSTTPEKERFWKMSPEEQAADRARRGITGKLPLYLQKAAANPQPQALTLPQQGQGMVNTLGQQSDQGIGGNIARIISLMDGYHQQPIPQDGQPNVYQQSAGAYNQALDATANPTMGIDVQNYFNPYESQVVDNTLNDLDRSRQMATNQMDYNAGRAGAFGGSRHGIAQAETNTGYAREAANVAAQLRNRGYENAQNFALRDASTGLEQARQFGSLANMGFSFGQDIQEQQSRQGLQQQLMNQALIDAAKQQYSGYTGSPYNSLDAFGNALGISNMNQGTTTKTQNNGLFDYLSLAANLYGG